MSTELLCQAIHKKTMVSFTYKKAKYTVESYAVGYEEQDERGRPLLLRAWYEGNWRDFEVKFMSRIEIEADPISGDRQGYRTMPITVCDVFGKTWPHMGKPLP